MDRIETVEALNPVGSRTAVGPWSDLALHTIGWRAFQDLCSQICEVVLQRPVEIFREAQDGGQDAVYLIPTQERGAPPVGTVQCKHSSDGTKALKISDLTPELDSVRALVAAGQADTYLLMTNMSIDAPVAVALRNKLRELGVRKPHILGRQYVVHTIRASARLRALVPQVYGLGDLTAIIDERLSEQSRALLDSWLPKLKTYVPTMAHREAVRAITDHGVVLLLGNPSTGKSAIGAIISTIAQENPDNTVLALTSPRDFEAGWNPNDPRRFFWIDDAFGSNVLREDYVQDWASAFTKLRAAIKHGNRFLLTSRKHIYEAARRRLGQRNLTEFSDGKAVVDVGELTTEEKSQILYNHVTYGGQSAAWKSRVKPFLAAVAAVPEFLPGIAERLGDPNFTKTVATDRESLVRFMEEPTEHLIETVNALDEHLRAALILVYVHQGGFDPSQHDAAAAKAVADLTGFSLSKIQDSFSELAGSFLKRSGQRWTFAHPTISDALTEILREKPHMMAALLRGATIDTILSSFTCEGSPVIKDALTIPAALDDALVGRLSETPDETHRNWLLFNFLAFRASEGVVLKIIKPRPELLRRVSWVTEVVDHNPKLNTHGRAHALSLLPADLRERAETTLLDSARDELDLSFFDNPKLLALIAPLKLIELGVSLRSEMLGQLEERIDKLVDEADLDDDADSHFEKMKAALDRLENMGMDDDGVGLMETARSQVKTSIEKLEERKRERDEGSDDDADWTHIVSKAEPRAKVTVSTTSTRSLFSDVDK